MPRIPLDIAKPVPVSPQPTARDFGLGAAAGLNRLGEGISDAGRGVNVVGETVIALEKAKTRREASLLAAKIEADYKKAETEAQESNSDPDKYKEDVENRRRAIDAKHLEGASEDTLKLIEARKLDLDLESEMNTRAVIRKRHVDGALANLAEEEQIAMDLYTTEPDPKKRKRIRENLFNSYDQAAEDILLTKLAVAKMKIAWDNESEPELRAERDQQYVNAHAAEMLERIPEKDASAYIDSLSGTAIQQDKLRKEMRTRYTKLNGVTDKASRDEMVHVYAAIHKDRFGVADEDIEFNNNLTSKDKRTAMRYLRQRQEKKGVDKTIDNVRFGELVKMMTDEPAKFLTENMFNDLVEEKITHENWRILYKEQNDRKDGLETEFTRLVVRGRDRASQAASSAELKVGRRSRFIEAYVISWLEKRILKKGEDPNAEDERQIMADLLRKDPTRLNSNEQNIDHYIVRDEIQGFEATLEQINERIDGPVRGWNQAWLDRAARVAKKEKIADFNTSDEVKRDVLRSLMAEDEKNGVGMFNPGGAFRTSQFFGNDPKVVKAAKGDR